MQINHKLHLALLIELQTQLKTVKGGNTLNGKTNNNKQESSFSVVVVVLFFHFIVIWPSLSCRLWWLWITLDFFSFVSLFVTLDFIRVEFIFSLFFIFYLIHRVKINNQFESQEKRRKEEETRKNESATVYKTTAWMTNNNNNSATTFG